MEVDMVIGNGMYEVENLFLVVENVSQPHGEDVSGRVHRRDHLQAGGGCLDEIDDALEIFR